MDKKIPIWGYNYKLNNYYENKPAVLRKPEKGMIKFMGPSHLYGDHYIYFFPLNKKGEIIKSRKIQFKNLEYAFNEQEAIDNFNQLINEHLDIIDGICRKVKSYKV